MNVCYKWVLGALFAFTCGAANAQSVHGVLRVVKGDVQIKSAKAGKNLKARVGEKVYPKDVIITAKDARAKIVMVDNNEINVSPESQVEIQHYEFDPNAGKKDVLLNVIYGKVRSKVEQKYDGKTSKFQVKTPSAVAGVRGTDFLTGFTNGATNVVTFEGTVEFGLPGPNGAIANPVMVTRGTTAGNTPGANPTPPAAIPKDQLAKMDAETKADGPKVDTGAPGADSRQPAGDDKKDKKADEGKKNEDAKKSEGNKEGNKDGNKDANKGANKDGNKGGNSGSGKSAGAGAPKGPGGPNGAAGGSESGDGGRAPANTAGPTAGGPAPEGACTMCGPIGGPGPEILPPPVQAPLVEVPIVPITSPILQPCDACRVGTEQGNSRLIIHVTN